MRLFIVIIYISGGIFGICMLNVDYVWSIAIKNRRYNWLLRRKKTIENI